MIDWKIGCAGLRGSRTEYFKRFDSVEVPETFVDPPTVRAMNRWRREAPTEFSFVVTAWQMITHPPEYPGYRNIKRAWERDKAGRFGSFQHTEQVGWAWEVLRGVAQALSARAIVFRTPASFTPTEANRRNLERFFSSIERENVLLVWDPEGLWAEDEVQDICSDLGLIRAQDPLQSRIPPRQDFYFRMKGKTRGRRAYDEDDFYRILDMAHSREVEGTGVGFAIWTTQTADMDAGRFRHWVRANEPTI